MTESSERLSVVAVGAHQDDVEITCLGMLLLYRELANAKVTIVVVSDGRAGGSSLPGLSPDEVVEVRRQEAQSVASALGADYICLNQHDQAVEDNTESRLVLTDVLRSVGADVVLAPPPNDYHTDHRATSTLASYAALISKVSAIETEHVALATAPGLYYVEPAGGFDWTPTEFVDITAVFHRKCELLALHKSQMGSISDIYGVDLVGQVERVNSYRGFQCGAPYAEAFMTAPAWGSIRPRGLPGI